MRQKPIPELDGLRGVAIVLVLLYHFVALYTRGAHGIDAGAHAVAGAGWTGVDLFFVLSGFLITGVLLDTKGEPHAWRNFAVRRCLRIFPLYYGALFALIVVLPLLHGHDPAYAELRAHQAWYWTYLVNVLVAFQGTQAVPLNTVHFWSLGIEEQFYFAWPFVVLFTRPRRLVQIAGATMVMGFVARAVTLHTLGVAAAYVLTPGRLDGLMVGAVTAVLAREPGGLDRWREFAWRMLGVGGALLVALAVWRGGLSYTDGPTVLLAFPVLALVYAAALVLALTTDGLWPRLLRTSGLRAWGRYSYGLYVIHYPLLWAIDLKLGGLIGAVGALAPGSRLPGVVVRIAIGVPLSYALAVASYHLYEKRFLTLKRYFVTGDKEPRSREPRRLGARLAHG